MFGTKSITRTTAAMTLVVGLTTAPAMAGDKAIQESDEAKRAAEAARVLHAMMDAEDSQIPAPLLEKATGIAVIPGVVKGAFLVGGRWGKGLVAKRTESGGWSAPVFVETGGVSYGFQVGVQSTDLVLVFTEHDGLEALLNDKIELGADVSVAAGPVGRHASAGTNLTLDSAIYSYSRTKGVFAGVALDGAVLTTDGSSNEAVYGHNDPAVILSGKETMPAAVKPFHDALHFHAETH